MSDRKIYLEFVESGVRGIIDMYWQNAPRTCEAIWGALFEPIRVPASHAMFAGPEIMMGLPENAQNFDPRALPPENQTVLPQPGEMMWYYQPKNFFKIDPSEFWELGFFYSEGGRTMGPTGWIACSYIGKMAHGLPEIAEQCRKIRIEGIKTVEIGRLK